MSVEHETNDASCSSQIFLALVDNSAGIIRFSDRASVDRSVSDIFIGFAEICGFRTRRPSGDTHARTACRCPAAARVIIEMSAEINTIGNLSRLTCDRTWSAERIAHYRRSSISSNFHCALILVC